MKKSALAFSLILITASIGLAQIVKIAPKKITYTRQGRDISKEKKTFVVTYPIVSGAISAEAKKKLENTISYWRVFETTLRESQEETWLTDLYYKVNYNKSGVLDIELTQEGVSAYPSAQTVDIVVNLKTGEQIKFNDAFKRNSLTKFAQMVDKKLQIEKAQIIKSIDADKYDANETKEEKETDKQMINELRFTVESFSEFSIGDKGVTILYDAGFAHAWQALQPDGRYFFSWAELKPFIKTDSLLEKFVR